MTGPIHPSITPALPDDRDLTPFQKISTYFVCINDLLNLQLQALNEEHHPNHCSLECCHCRGQYLLVTYLGIDIGWGTEGFDALGRQHIHVCARFYFL